jgi:hypothetical protein
MSAFGRNADIRGASGLDIPSKFHCKFARVICARTLAANFGPKAQMNKQPAALIALAFGWILRRIKSNAQEGAV